jgi:hypothetical protein
MRKWNGWLALPFHRPAHAAMHFGNGTITDGWEAAGRAGHARIRRFAGAKADAGMPKIGLRRAWENGLRQAIGRSAVMLHLRSRYVSKAAIFTVPVLPAPVENRSPA